MKRIITVLAVVIAIWLAGASPTLGATVKPVSYLTFLNHTSAIFDDIYGHMEDLTSSLDAYDAYGALTDSRGIVSAATSELKWLTTHKPASSCFKKYWNAWKAEMAGFKSTYTYMKNWLDSYPYGSDYDYQMFMTKSDALSPLIERASDALTATQC